MDSEKVAALMQELDIQRKALARAREMVEAIYQEKQEETAETEEDWIRANLKEGDLVEVRTGNDDTWFLLAATKDRLRVWSCLRLPRNRWLPRLGGECPVPGWMPVQAITCNYVGINDLAVRLDWGRSDPALKEHESDIIAYRIPEDQS